MPSSKKEICNKYHGDLPLRLMDLPASQAHPLRHGCVGCAYELGFEAGLKAAKEKASGLSYPPGVRNGS